MLKVRIGFMNLLNQELCTTNKSGSRCEVVYRVRKKGEVEKTTLAPSPVALIIEPSLASWVQGWFANSVFAEAGPED